MLFDLLLFPSNMFYIKLHLSSTYSSEKKVKINIITIEKGKHKNYEKKGKINNLQINIIYTCSYPSNNYTFH